MHYHLLLTEKCNSECRYCYEKSLKEAELQTDIGRKFNFDFSAPESSEVDVNKLKNFLDKDKEAVIIFYGGEPLLETGKIKEMMDKMDIQFRMQTNGKLLKNLPVKYLRRIGKILISIDGNKERTDYNKGKGTYDLVINNIKWLRSEGYRGELIARMTISAEFPDLCEQVKHLLSLDLFDSIHWQLDAGFYKFDFNKEKFEKFVEEYNKSMSKLIEFWVKEMKSGKVHRLYPFIAVADSILKGEKTLLRCGAGHSGYAITTNGRIVACPIMNCIKDFEAGTLESSPEDLKTFQISECSSCPEKDLCGGRCLYWRKAKLWPDEGDNLVCRAVRHYLNELKNKLPEIKSLIEKGIIKQEDFSHEKYFGPEIIP